MRAEEIAAALAEIGGRRWGHDMEPFVTGGIGGDWGNARCRRCGACWSMLARPDGEEGAEDFSAYEDPASRGIPVDFRCRGAGWDPVRES